LSPPGQARTIKNGSNNRLFVRHSCEALFNSRRLVKQEALHNSEAGHPVPLVFNDLKALDPGFRRDDEQNQSFLKVT